MTHWKRPWCWEGLGTGGEGDDRGWDGWMASQTRWTWVWVNSGSWWCFEAWCADSWGHKESDTTKRLNWTELMLILSFYKQIFCLTKQFIKNYICAHDLRFYLYCIVNIHVYLSLFLQFLFCSCLTIHIRGSSLLFIVCVISHVFSPDSFFSIMFVIIFTCLFLKCEVSYKLI